MKPKIKIALIGSGGFCVGTTTILTHYSRGQHDTTKDGGFEKAFKTNYTTNVDGQEIQVFLTDF